MKHFQYFPKFDYGTDKATNIMVRGRVRDMIRENAALYYPYVVTDADRPDVLSHRYYGSSDFTWAIFYANDIFDPQYDWPLSETSFSAYIESKYGSIENSQSLADETLVIIMGNGSLNFLVGEAIYQGDSLATALSKAVVTAWDPNKRQLRVKNVEGVFIIAQGNIKGNATNASWSLLDKREIIHHYELIPSGLIIDKYTFDDPLQYTANEKRAVSNYDYEVRLNEAKRNIVLIEDKYISGLNNELKQLFK